MDYLKTDEEQYSFSKKKELELQERYNDMIARHSSEEELLNSKLSRHRSIIDQWETKDYE